MGCSPGAAALLLLLAGSCCLAHAATESTETYSWREGPSHNGYTSTYWHGGGSRHHSRPEYNAPPRPVLPRCGSAASLKPCSRGLGAGEGRGPSRTTRCRTGGAAAVPARAAPGPCSPGVVVWGLEQSLKPLRPGRRGARGSGAPLPAAAAAGVLSLAHGARWCALGCASCPGITTPARSPPRACAGPPSPNPATLSRTAGAR